MNYKIFRLGKATFVVSKPSAWAYGHLALEILLALKVAEEIGASVYLIRDKNAVNKALYDIWSDRVEIVPKKGWKPVVLYLLWTLSMGRERVRSLYQDCVGSVAQVWRTWRSSLIRNLKQGLKKVKKNKRLSRKNRRWIVENGKKFIQKLSRKEYQNREPEDPQRGPAPYFRRRALRTPLTIYLPRDLNKAAVQMAERAGIPSTGDFVTLHVRERGYRGTLESDIQNIRNARIESYFQSIDYLVSLGYKVVRVGDPLMSPVERSGLVDLANSPLRSDLLDLWCLMNCKFLIGCDSGPNSVVYLTNTPALIVNVTNVIGSFPARRNFMYILKRVRERDTGRILSLSDLLDAKYLGDFPNLSLYEYIENSEDEILEAVKEMLGNVEGKKEESSVQLRYKNLLLEAAESAATRYRYIRKWGPDEGFMGDGRIGHVFVERYLYCGEVAGSGVDRADRRPG